jgi:hypothetical protein
MLFSTGLKKIAVTVVTMTPTEFYEHVGAGDKYKGAIGGAGAGAAIGLLRGKHGNKSKVGLIGAGLGAASGGVAGHEAGKIIRKYQANKVYRMAGELNLKSTPGRGGHRHEGT